MTPTAETVKNSADEDVENTEKDDDVMVVRTIVGKRITRAGHRELKKRSLVDSDKEEEDDETARDDCYDSTGSDSTEKRKAKSILRF